MRQARIPLTLLCNQNCGFCNQRAAVDARIDVKQRIDECEAEEILLSGGEPLLRNDLPGIVAYAQKKARVILETNGALLDEKRIEALKRAGLERARIHLPAWECDEITRDPGGFSRTRASIDLLREAGIEVEFAAPIVRANRDSLPDLPRHIQGNLYVGVPIDAPDRSTLLPFEEAATVLHRVAMTAREVGVTVRVDPSAPIPPCLLPERMAHLFSLTRGGAARERYRQLADCCECVVSDRCPGVPHEMKVKPIREERTRRRLTLISSVEEQIAREVYGTELHREPDGSAVEAGIVRVNFHCNQACRFCFVSTHLPPPSDDAVRAAIAKVGTGPIIFSGGEPTLNPKLPEWIRLARAQGVRSIELQTNAMRIDEALDIDVALVSLHAADAETSDAITEAPGTFEKTVRGIDALAKTKIEIRLNFVFCEKNREKFPDFVDFVGARWPNAKIVVSFVAASTELVPRDASLIPRYCDILPHLAEGLRRSLVPILGFESMCGIPLCLVPENLSSFFELPVAPRDPEFMKTETCRECSLESRCWGIRRGYAELHGTSELRAIQ